MKQELIFTATQNLATGALSHSVVIGAGTEEMVKSDLTEGGGGGVGGNMPADTGLGLVAADDHGHRVPAD